MYAKLTADRDRFQSKEVRRKQPSRIQIGIRQVDGCFPIASRDLVVYFLGKTTIYICGNFFYHFIQDDLWRRNHDSISGLRKYAADFNPHYKTSIAYTPLPRPALESFLIQRGLLHKTPHFFDFFHAGFLNKLYLRLNDTVYRKSKSVCYYFPIV